MECGCNAQKPFHNDSQSHKLHPHPPGGDDVGVRPWISQSWSNRTVQGKDPQNGMGLVRHKGSQLSWVLTDKLNTKDQGNIPFSHDTRGWWLKVGPNNLWDLFQLQWSCDPMNHWFLFHPLQFHVCYLLKRRKKYFIQEKAKFPQEAACRTVFYCYEDYGIASLILWHQMAGASYLQTVILFNVFHPEKECHQPWYTEPHRFPTIL